MVSNSGCRVTIKGKPWLIHWEWQWEKWRDMEEL